MGRIARWGGGALFLAALLSFGVVGDPFTVRWTLISLMAVLAVGWFVVSLIRRPMKWAPPLTPLACLAGWAALSLVWSPDWRQGLASGAHATALGVVLVAVSCVSRETLRALIPAVIGLAVLGALVLQGLSPQSYGGFGNDNWQTEFLLIALPFVFVFWRFNEPVPKAVGLWVAITGTVYLFLPGGSYAKWLVLGSLLVILAGWLLRAGRTWWGLVLSLVLANAGLWFAILNPGMLARKVAQRFELALNTAFMWLETPVFGHGFGSFNHEYGRFAEAHLSLFPNMDTLMRPMHVIAGQAHNEPMQLLAELGLVGFLLAAWFVWSCVKSGRDELDWAALASLFIVGVVGLVAFPFQNPATALLAAAAFGILVNGRYLPVWVPRLANVFPGAVGIAVAGCVALMAHGSLFAHASFVWTRELITKDPAQALNANLIAIQWWPFDGHMRLQSALSFANVVTNERDRLRVTPTAADKIHAMAMSSAPYSVTVLLSRIEYLTFAERQEERREEIESILTFLKSHASLQPSVWLTEALWAGRNNDAQRMMVALERGHRMSKDPETYYRPQFEKLAELLTNEEQK